MKFSDMQIWNTSILGYFVILINKDMDQKKIGLSRNLLCSVRENREIVSSGESSDWAGWLEQVKIHPASSCLASVCAGTLSGSSVSASLISRHQRPWWP